MRIPEKQMPDLIMISVITEQLRIKPEKQ